ncbi:MAG: hypothetical protein H7196_03740 [candidate division SR1 bacterium]|nr:hypothetical protein [candidate division SR1 bacterium]
MKRWITLCVSILSFLLGGLSIFNSLVFHRLERLFLIAGLIIGVYIWIKYIKPASSRAAITLTYLVFILPLLFDHFLISETGGVFLLIYLGIIGYLAKINSAIVKPLLYALIIFLGINFLTMIIQVLSSHSIGLSILGEVSLNMQTQKGLATEFISGHQFLRGYGLFIHPNIAGFVGSLSLLFFVFFDFSDEQIKRIGKYFAIGIMFLSFSRIAWISGLIVFWYVLSSSKVSSKLKYFIMTFGSLITSLIFIARYNFSDVYRFTDIQKYFEAYGQTTVLQKLFGVGLGAYPFFLKSKFPNLASWQYEPVHNSLLLIFIEFGGLSILIMSTLLYTLFFMKSKKD